jgi:hypothetical protein
MTTTTTTTTATLTIRRGEVFAEVDVPYRGVPSVRLFFLHLHSQQSPAPPVHNENIAFLIYIVQYMC